MFGHKVQADGKVVAGELLHRSKIEHKGDHPSFHEETWRFVVDVAADGGALRRVELEDTIKVGLFDVPKVGRPVRVEFEEKHPDRASLLLEGDPHYDRMLKIGVDRARADAAHDADAAAVASAIRAPAGSPPPRPDPTADDGDDDGGDDGDDDGDV
jgi:hypothetical protein